ncbi:MAG: hypothetical protein JO040_04775, partial [Gemmatimonadetes bacterium]|nr:hypothetical protein [Gemmatimonadota bacterium]
MSSIDYGVSPDALLERIAEKEQEIAELKNRLREWEDGFARTPSREANFTSVSGAEVAPLYTPLDRPEPGSEEAGYYLDRIGLPGEFPFTRGPYGTMYRTRLWTMRQF